MDISVYMTSIKLMEIAGESHPGETGYEVGIGNGITL